MITAKIAATALRNVTSKLVGAGILLAESQGILDQEAGRLTRMGGAIDWDVGIPVGRALRFEATTDKDGNEIRVFLSASKIGVNQSDENTPIFEALDAAIVVLDRDDCIVARWHIDRANTGVRVQPGPLYHLQYGGHHPGSDEPDLPLSVPRWNYPPLEIALLCEIVAANFFHDKWNDELRTDVGWCNAIHTFQSICFNHYFEKMQICLQNRETTVLGSMWADRWS